MVGARAMPVQVGRPVRPVDKRKAFSRRMILARWIARMQAAELKDPAAAAKTLTEALKVLEAADAKLKDNSTIEHVRLRLLRDLAIARQASGRPRDALAAWAKLHEACRSAKFGSGGGLVDIARVAEAFARLPAGQEVPEIDFLIVLTPERPKAGLTPDDPQTRKRSYYPSGNPNTPHWKYALTPPPGKEFASLEFACDIEQIKARHGGHFQCYVMTRGEHPARYGLGEIGWPADKAPGREVRKGAFKVPPGVSMVHVETGSWKGCFNIHSIEVAATFRPAAKDPPALAPGAWMQTEALPPGGGLTCGDKQLRSERAYTDFAPGRYRLTYKVPGRADSFVADYLVQPGRRHGIFVNLDSPFGWAQAGPGRLSSHPPGRASIAPLPDGGYLAVWCAAGSRIMLSRTKDLTAWSKPQPAPFNSVFENICPATLTDADGTVHLAFFSKRISLMDTGTGGYRLWLTSTRDGRTWQRLRPVSVAGEISGSPLGGIHMFRGPDGEYRIFWRHYAAAGKSVADIRTLRAINISRGQLQLWNPHVTAGENGLFHVVFDSFGQGIYHATSKDAENWSPPAALVEAKDGQSTRNPQLFLAKGKAALLYEQNDGAYLIRLRLGDKAQPPREGVKITNHVVPLSGSRATITPAGEVLLLAGGDTSWLLRAKLQDVLAVKAGK